MQILYCLSHSSRLWIWLGGHRCVCVCERDRTRVHMHTHALCPPWEQGSLFGGLGMRRLPRAGDTVCPSDRPQLRAPGALSRPRGEGDAHLHWLRGQLNHVLHALAVMVPWFLFINHIPLMLGKVQETADGTEVLPESAVFWAGVLLPAEQFTQPALETEKATEWTWKVHSHGGGLSAVNTAGLYFHSRSAPTTLGRCSNSLATPKTNEWPHLWWHQHLRIFSLVNYLIPLPTEYILN